MPNKLQPPPVEYDRDISRFMIYNVTLAYGLYSEAIDQISDLPACFDPYQPGPEFHQTAQIRAYTDFGDIDRWGFALQSDKRNVIALRGTETPWEWFNDIDSTQRAYDVGPNCPSDAKVHTGFWREYTEYKYIAGESLSKSVREAAASFTNPNLPLYVSGHSLGGPISCLAAMDVVFNVPGYSPNSPVFVYNYASPRTGNPAFVRYYNSVIPNTYRIVNLADVVPVLPPSDLDGYQFQHVGQPWIYLNQAGNVTTNHAHATNYADAVVKRKERNIQPDYPISV